MADTNGELPANLRYLGNQFQLWRVDAGVKREAAAEAVGYSVETVKSVEYGRRKCPPKMALIGDELFGAKGKLKAGLQYQEPEKYAPKAQDFISIEQQASWLWTYQALHIPGLLQTEKHARTLMEDHWPPLDDETVEQRLAARMERQQLISPAAKPLVEYSCVLAEPVFRVPVGGADTHREQLLHVLEVGKQRNVSVQVLPFERMTDTSLAGPLVLVETEEQEFYGYAEAHMATRLTSDAKDTDRLLRRYGRIRMQALSVEESAQFIERTVAEL